MRHRTIPLRPQRARWLARGLCVVAILGTVALGTAAANAQPSAIKWDQPPDPAQPENLFYGWNERSDWWDGPVVADDWVCTTSDPVTGIRWWGSFLGWNKPYAPQLPNHFHIQIWTDVPSGGGIGDFSHPGQVIHEITCFNYTYQFVGYDFDPRTQEYEACFLFEQVLQPSEYFYQSPGSVEPNIYWLSIAACEGGPTMLPHPFGWKTRPRDLTSLAPDDAVVVMDPIQPAMGSQYVAGRPIFWPTVDKSWDMAFELMSERTIQEIKWDQPPLFSLQSPYPQCYWGWDERSTRNSVQIVADDWACTDTRPVTDLHWWGSYNNWQGTTPPGTAPTAFHIGIWKDVPGGGGTYFSHPGQMIWEYIASRTQLNERAEGCDYHPYRPHMDTCFVYDLNIPQSNWFYQDPAGGDRQIYWVSISAIYQGSVPSYWWGWKTRLRDLQSAAPDDAVKITNPLAPVVGMMYVAGQPIEYPTGVSWDTAFRLTTQTYVQAVKWSQPPQPYTPEDAYNGWNEYSVYDQYQIVADDWVCSTPDPVTDIHWWGSFLGWDHRGPPPVTPQAFHIAIWTDVQPSGEPGDFSHPGQVVWQTTCTNFTWQFVGWDFDPRVPHGKSTTTYQPPEACFKFEQFLTPAEWFYQSPGPANGTIYWLSIAAIYPAGTTIEYPWGWKTRPRVDSLAPDDAVRIYDPTAPVTGSAYVSGSPIEWLGQSWDVAFVLTTQTTPKPTADLGDAPDSTNSAGALMTAYPKGGPLGVQANYPTVYVAGSPPFGPIHQQPKAVAFLGAAVSLENEADVGPDEDGTNNLDPPNDSPDHDGSDDAVQVPLCLPHCDPTTTFTYTVTVVAPVGLQLFVNVWFDWNRDGDWDDTLDCPDSTAPEWAVQNQALVFAGPGVYTVTTPAFTPWHPTGSTERLPIWMRITLAEQRWNPVAGSPGYGGSGPAVGYEYGETEDYYFVPAEPPNITAAISRKVHGAAGTFDVDICAGSIEPRKGGATQVIVTFNRPIQQVTGTNADVTLSSGVVNALAIVGGNQLDISMSGATDATPLIIGFPGIADATNILCIVRGSICLRLLIGDVNDDGTVNIFDLVLVRNNLNKPVVASNFRSDVTADGAINIFDLVMIRNNLNKSVAPCPIAACP